MTWKFSYSSHSSWVLFVVSMVFSIPPLFGVPLAFTEGNRVLPMPSWVSMLAWLCWFSDYTAHERLGRPTMGALVNTVRNLAQGIHSSQRAVTSRWKCRQYFWLVVAFPVAMKLHLSRAFGRAVSVIDVKSSISSSRYSSSPTTNLD